jgi:methanogenic corrinoid protein MtbC1
MPMTGTLVRSAGYQVRAQAEALADAVVACEFARHPELLRRFGPGGRWKSRRDSIGHLLHLADALDTRSPALFDDHVGWVKAVLQPSGVDGDDVDRRLACMAEALHARMPPAVAAPALEMIEGARAALPAMPGASATLLDPAQHLSALARDYMVALLGGYRQAAARLVFDAADRGEPVGELYLRVFQPALREVGRLWQVQKISVAQEHFCSAATQVLMSQLLPRAVAAERRRRTIVVVCVSGERHEVGARMVGDFFEMDGWDTYFCGADTPHGDVVQALVEREADVLAISATMGCLLHAVQELIEQVRADPRGTRQRILVGGHPFSVDPALWQSVGADATADDAGSAVALARRGFAPA